MLIAYLKWPLALHYSFEMEISRKMLQEGSVVASLEENNNGKKQMREPRGSFASQTWFSKGDIFVVERT